MPKQFFCILTLKTLRFFGGRLSKDLVDDDNRLLQEGHINYVSWWGNDRMRKVMVVLMMMMMLWWWYDDDDDDDDERNNNIDKAGGDYNINNDAFVNLAVISESLDGMFKT